MEAKYRVTSELARDRLIFNGRRAQFHQEMCLMCFAMRAHCATDLERVVCVYRLQLEWSVLGFVQSHYVVCEDAGLLAISIRRAGALNHSSSVAVRIRSMSAKETSDFAAKSSPVVEFSPG